MTDAPCRKWSVGGRRTADRGSKGGEEGREEKEKEKERKGKK